MAVVITLNYKQANNTSTVTQFSINCLQCKLRIDTSIVNNLVPFMFSHSLRNTFDYMIKSSSTTQFSICAQTHTRTHAQVHTHKPLICPCYVQFNVYSTNDKMHFTFITLLFQELLLKNQRKTFWIGATVLQPFH